MRRPTPKCKGCNDRAPECHATCENYLKYKKALEGYNDKIKEEKSKEVEARDLQIKGKERCNKALRRRFMP